MERQQKMTNTPATANPTTSNDEEHNATSTASTTGTATNSRGAIKYRRQRSSSFFDSTRQVTITLGGDDDHLAAAGGLEHNSTGGTAMSRSAPKDRIGILSFSPSRASGTVVVTPADMGSTTTTSALPFLPIAVSSDHSGVGGVPNSPGGAPGGDTTTSSRERRRMTSLYDMSSTMNRLRSSLVGYVEPPPSRPTAEGTPSTTMTEVHHGSPHLPLPDNVDSSYRRPTKTSNLRKNETTMMLEPSSQTASHHSNDGTGTYGAIPLVPLVHDSRLPTMLHPPVENGKQPTRTDGSDRADDGGVGDPYSSTATTTNSTTPGPGPEDTRCWRNNDAQTKKKCFASCRKNYWWRNNIQFAMGQIPAVIIMGLFHLMIGIPFGVSYFPIGWSSATSSSGGTTSSSEDATDNDSIHGPFPLPGKEALGIRMFLFSTMIGQIVFTYRSQFHNPIGLQMVENVPFCHALSVIVIQHVGYGTQALSTLVVMFGLSSIIVGFVFYILGYYKLGRIIYFFPTHVLVGCIGGIGLFIAKTGIEVTINRSFNPFMEEFWTWSKEGQLWGVVLLFEITLRLLERITKHQYSLLGPIYFLCITPIFYAMLFILNIPMSYANNVGYFFPSLDDNHTDEMNNNHNHNSFFSVIQSLFHDDTLWDYWHVVDFRTVSWKAILDSTPTLIALTLFSLIHVPINIPAFAISSNTEVDMNNELVAHGYSNALSGVCGGLQNYMAYTQSVLYDKSKGTGKGSGIAVACLTGLLFVIGPKIASYIPKCMAGTLLLHVGIDLFLEGVYDSYSKFDKLEYGGIWCIAIVMTLYGMDAAMMTGVIAAVSTYAVQNITYLTPIRGHMSATTLRSSQWNRNQPSQQILDSPTVGRCRILVVQLQGHLFFGNMAHLTESLQKLVVATNDKATSTNENHNKDEESSSSYWWIVILDLSLVLGIDSSAAQAIIKLKTAMLTKYHIPLIFFVSGSRHGFPCEINLTKELSTPSPVDARHPARQHHPSPSTANGSSNKKKASSQSKKKKGNDVGGDSPVGAVMVQSSSDAHFDTSSTLRRRISQPKNKDDDERSSSSDVAPCIDVDEETALLLSKQEGENNETIHGNGGTTTQHHDPFSGSYVCESLDAALLFAENALIAKQDPNLLEDDLGDHHISLHDNDGGAGGGGGAYPWLSYRGNAHPKSYSYRWDEDMSLDEEREVALHYLTSLCRSHALSSSSSSSSSSNNNVEDDMKELFMHFERQVFYQDDYLWKQGDVSDSCKLIIRGDLIALLENEAGTTEYIACGNVIGEFGLVSGSTRMTSVQCLSPRCIVYSLPKQIFDDPNILHPRLARFIDQLCVLYLGNRVQHVSNRIFETRCLPI